MKKMKSKISDYLGRGAGPVKIALLGFPTDEGVERNGGRPGAKDAPKVIREALLKMTPDPRQKRAIWLDVRDEGDIEISGGLEEAQKRLGAKVGALIKKDIIPIVIGGGHETAYGNFLGFVEAGEDVSVINIDAHPDVRELVGGKGHSGSPFRQILEHESGRCKAYQVIGLEGHSVAKEHLEYLVAKNCHLVWRDEIEVDSVLEAETSVMLSLDLDALDQASAPGVSAPNPRGLDIEQWLGLIQIAILSGKVKSIDIVECNPKYDRDGQTAKLAAHTIWTIIERLSLL